MIHEDRRRGEKGLQLGRQEPSVAFRQPLPSHLAEGVLFAVQAHATGKGARRNRITNWQKWLIGIPLIIGLSLGLSGLITGQVRWFVRSWTDTVFVLVLTIIGAVSLALYPAGHGLCLRGTLTVACWG